MFRIMKIGCGVIVLGFIVMFILFLSHDFSPTKVIDGVEYSDYGLLDQSRNENPNIEYKPNWTNIVVGAVLIETVIAPVYIFGYHFMEPVGPRPAIPGQVTH
ncbi:MAG: hypothetical protein WCW78_02120 [Candidatus Paceibacterota bacterium]